MQNLRSARQYIWSQQRTYGEGGDDIGDTYVEIDYTNQRMWFYKDGELLVDTPVVTGNTSKKNGSPDWHLLYI